MLTRRSLGRAAALAGAAALARPASAQAYPVRPIQFIVPWGAGGGTDYHSRTIAALMERELGQPVNVVNRTGGSGVVGHSAIAEAAPDGYTIGAVTVEIGMMHWQGLTRLTWRDYTPIAMMNLVPAGVQVAADSPWRTLKDMIDAIRANPGRYKSSGTGQGGIWHLAIAGLLQSVGLPPDAAPWIPSDGAASGLRELVAGGVHIVPCGIAEAAPLIRAGRVRSLAVMMPQRLPAFPDVPTVKEAIGSDWTLASYLSVMGPKGLPAAIARRLEEAALKAMATEQWKAAMEARGFGVNPMPAAELAAFVEKSDRDLGAVMRALGLART
ncbi:tripartite tricarboxylate transporter substrate binding protein [Elioraea thermophila]|uniref:tripartite tricarboxylate transporter substrate binding protein n=1 Tax=Elioraea thermophila TaxID=2185104 RepID=UPI000DF4A91D|nr:tripartite tricarboxylate transporter substrate binding protein [Elioraea thermophila]